ncbi:MAG: imelysin family protein [Verrucomicrobiales bacterium]
MKVHYIPVPLGLCVAVMCLVSTRLSAEESNAASGGEQALKALEPKDLAQAKHMAVKTYAQIVEATSMSAFVTAIELRKKIEALVTDPTPDNHVAAKLSWVQARLPYLQTEALFSYGSQAAAMNSWPVRPGYIDYIDGNPESGIICDPDGFPDLSPESLERMNGRGGEGNIATGYHVIEFLLWGETSGLVARGKRTHIDYDPGKTKYAVRRGTFLVGCCDLLIRQLTDQLAEWKADVPGNSRARFETLPTDEALGKIFTGIALFAGRHTKVRKTGGIKVAEGQPGGQATFSGLGYIDLAHNVAGIANIVAGAYVGLDGKVKVLGVGLIGVAEQVTPVRSKRLRAYMNASTRAAHGINRSFDPDMVKDGDLPERKLPKILTNALGHLLKEVDKLAVDLEI